MKSITQDEDREYQAMEAERREFKYNELAHELRDEQCQPSYGTKYRSRWAEDRAAYSTPGSDW